MTLRQAACVCGQLHLAAEGEPRSVLICHCTACQRRTGSAFGAHASFDEDRVETDGAYTEFARVADHGDERVSAFCPTCGATLFIRLPTLTGVVFVPIGAFADATFPPPGRSKYESRRHPWVGLPEDIAHEPL
jgi:hypothetical protein